MHHEILSIDNAAPASGYSHCARSGNTLYIAGQVSLDAAGKLVGEGDIEAQARQVYANLANIIGQAGGDLTDIVKMTTYLTSAEYIEGYRKVRNSLFTEPMPPNTLVVVSRLAAPTFFIEVEATAVLG